MSADLAALLAAIYQQPDDDAARMVYADALQELGDPRGELVALQIQGGAKGRVRALLKRHGRSWLGELAPIALTFTFERGFPAVVAIDVSKDKAIRGVAKSLVWSTIHTVGLGGSFERVGKLNVPRDVNAFEKMQTSAIRALAKAPGFATREFSTLARRHRRVDEK